MKPKSFHVELARYIEMCEGRAAYHEERAERAALDGDDAKIAKHNHLADEWYGLVDLLEGIK